MALLLFSAAVFSLILTSVNLGFAARKYIPDLSNILKPADKPKAIEPEEVTPPKVVVKTVLVPVQAKRKPKDPFNNLMDDHRFYEALRIVEKRIQADPNSVYWQLVRAQVLRLDQEYQLSEEAYQSLFPKIKTKSLLSQAYYGFGMLRFTQAEQFRRLGDEVNRKALLDEATSIFQQSIAVRPSVDAWAGVANIALLQNRLDDCSQALAKARQLSPGNLSVQLTEGYLALAQNNSTLARQAAYRIRNQAPDDPRSLMLLGRSAMVESRFDDAIIHFRQLSERLPDNTEALHWLSKAYEKKDRLEDAEAVLEKAVFINPFDWDAAQSLIGLYERSGDSQRSILLTKTILAQVATREQKEGQNYAIYRMMLEDALATRLVQTRQWQEAYILAKKTLDTCYQNTKPASLIPVSDPAGLPSADIPQQSLANYCQAQHLNHLRVLAESAYFSGEGMVYWSRFYDDLTVKQALLDLHEAVQQKPDDGSRRLSLLLIDPLATLPPYPAVSSMPQDFQAFTYRIQEAFLTGERTLYSSLLEQISTLPTATPHAQLTLAERLYELGDMVGSRQLAAKLPVSSAFDIQDEVKDLILKIDMQEQDMPNRLKALKTLPKDQTSQFWVRMATAAIRTSPYDLKLRSMVADSLEAQQDFSSAAVQLRLAAQYAPSAREKASCLKKVERLNSKVIPPQAVNQTSVGSSK